MCVAAKLLPLMPNPSAGSANPTASLPSLWGYVLAALNHIVRSPTNAIDKAPAIDLSYHMGIHTATYNYFAAQSEAANPSQADHRDAVRQASGSDIYEYLDNYYSDFARELLSGAPDGDDATLIRYRFKRYSVGAHSVDRLLNYVNRHYVKRAVDEAEQHAEGGASVPKMKGKIRRPGAAAVGDKAPPSVDLDTPCASSWKCK